MGDHKTINSMRYIVRLLVIVSLVLGALSFVSCSREKPEEGESSAPLPSPYSNESVFIQVQAQLEENPEDTEALFHLGELYYRNSQYPEAIDAYKKGVALKPDMGYAYVKLGTSYDRIDKPEEAIEAFQEATKYLPDYAVLYNNMGVAYGKVGKLDEEIAALKKALELRPYYMSARYNLSLTYMKKGDKKAAMREYEELKKYDEGAAENLMKELNSST